MSSLKFNRDNDEENLLAAALYVGKQEDDDDDGGDLWNNAFKDGHDFIRRQMKERKTIPVITQADNIPKQKINVPGCGSRGGRNKVPPPTGCCPCPAWQREQVADFSKVRLALSQHMALLKSTTQPQQAKIPDKRNEALWCHFCFGSNVWKLIKESSEDDSCDEAVNEEDKVKDSIEDGKVEDDKVVAGRDPLVRVVSSLPSHVVEVVLEYQVGWFTKVGWFRALGPWLYALLARLEKPLTPDTGSLIRSLVLVAAEERARIVGEKIGGELDQDIAALNLFVCLISEYFSQADLADREDD